MKNAISPETLEFLSYQYANTIYDWISDDNQFDPFSEKFNDRYKVDFINWLNKMIIIGQDIDKDFWELVTGLGTEYYRNKTNELLKKAIAYSTLKQIPIIGLTEIK